MKGLLSSVPTLSKPAWAKLVQNNFSGGENLLASAASTETNQLLSMQNCIVNDNGTIETRLGKEELIAAADMIPTGGASTDPVYGVWVLGDLNTVTFGYFYIVVHKGASIFAARIEQKNPEDSYPYVELTTAITEVKNDSKLDGYRLEAVTFKDNLIMFGGSDLHPFRFDGNACYDLGANAPHGTTVAVYAGRLWTTANIGYRHLVYYSDLESYDDWDGLNVINMTEEGEDDVVCFIPQEESLSIMLRRHQYTLYGTNKDNFRLVGPLPTGVGCGAPQGHCTETQVFMGRTNFYRAQPTGASEFPRTHTPFLETTTRDESRAPTMYYQSEKQRTYVTFCGKNNDFLWNFDTLESRRCVLVIDHRHEAMFMWTGLDATCIAACEGPKFNSELLVGCVDGSVHLLVNQDDDNGTDIVTKIRTPFLGSDDCDLSDKVWRLFAPQLDLLSSHSAFDVTMGYVADRQRMAGSNIDGSPDADDITDSEALDWNIDDWNQANWAGTGVVDNLRYWVNGVRSPDISFSIITNARVRLSGYSVKYREAGAV